MVSIRAELGRFWSRMRDVENEKEHRESGGWTTGKHVIGRQDPVPRLWYFASELWRATLQISLGVDL